MPVLKNAWHERFAQALAKGMTATDAYTEAGYKGEQDAALRKCQQMSTFSSAQSEAK